MICISNKHLYARSLLIFCLIFFSLFNDNASAQSLCGNLKRPKVQFNLILDLPDVAYNFSKSQQELTNEHQDLITDWLQTNGIENTWLSNHLSSTIAIGGLATGGFAHSSQYELTAMPYDRYGTHYCPFIKSLTINLFYRTLIFIPQDLKKGSCAFDLTMEHEWKHHLAYLESVKENTEFMERDMNIIMSEIENRGYVKYEQVDARFKDMGESLKDAIKIYLDAMNEGSRWRNEQIDSPQEYSRVDRAIKACEKERQSLSNQNMDGT